MLQVLQACMISNYLRCIGSTERHTQKALENMLHMRRGCRCPRKVCNSRCSVMRGQPGRPAHCSAPGAVCILLTLMRHTETHHNWRLATCRQAAAIYRCTGLNAAQPACWGAPVLPGNLRRPRPASADTARRPCATNDDEACGAMSALWLGHDVAETDRREHRRIRMQLYKPGMRGQASGTRDR